MTAAGRAHARRRGPARGGGGGGEGAEGFAARSCQAAAAVPGWCSWARGQAAGRGRGRGGREGRRRLTGSGVAAAR